MPMGLMLLMPFLAPSFWGASERVITVCKLFENLQAFNGQEISVRGTFYSSRHDIWLGQSGCGTRFKTPGVVWPTEISLETTSRKEVRALVDFETDRDAIEGLPFPHREYGESGRTIQVTATFVGLLQLKDSYPRPDPALPPKPGRGGFGWLGLYPARLIVKTVLDVEVKPISGK